MKTEKSLTFLQIFVFLRTHEFLSRNSRFNSLKGKHSRVYNLKNLYESFNKMQENKNVRTSVDEIFWLMLNEIMV